MKIHRTVSAVRRAVRTGARPLVLVPTMGALHAGHLSLIRRARRVAGPRGTVAVSLFVNPTQFGPGEDFSRYPRPVRADLAACREAGVDWVFAPAPAAMYASDHSVWVDEDRLSRGLCGGSRPGHFRGVCTVVSKLFLLTDPDAAVFGRKDYQQLAVIRRLVRDLGFGVRIVAAPTVREPDGLAMSSRNRFLSPEHRRLAGGFPRVLREAAARVGAGGRRAVGPARVAAIRALARIPGVTVDYVEVVEAGTLGPVRRGRRWVVAGAIRIGGTRLIDNVEGGRLV